MMLETVRWFARDEWGADLVEYALLIAVVAMGCAAALSGLATTIVKFFWSVADMIPVI